MLKQPTEVFYKRYSRSLKNSLNFTENYLCLSHLFNKASLSLELYLKGDPAHVLPVNFQELFRTPFLTEQLSSLLLNMWLRLLSNKLGCKLGNYKEATVLRCSWEKVF